MIDWHVCVKAASVSVASFGIARMAFAILGRFKAKYDQAWESRAVEREAYGYARGMKDAVQAVNELHRVHFDGPGCALCACTRAILAKGNEVHPAGVPNPAELGFVQKQPKDSRPN